VSLSQSSCQAYTALFDLDREKVDGRTFQDYLEWLKRTTELIPGLIIFHDGELDNLNFGNSRLIKIDLAELQAFSHLNELKEVLAVFKPHAANDITFQLPEYGLIQLSKFELGCKVIQMTDAESVLWVDAGISRFLDNTSRPNRLQDFASLLLENHFAYFFEIDTRRNLNVFRLQFRHNGIGTSKRLVAGGAFWIRREEVETLHRLMLHQAELWLKIGVWDNEQMLLREVIPGLREKVLFYRKGRGETGCVARVMINYSWSPNELLNNLYNFLMRKQNYGIR
jgi:hypothetical protein